MDNRLIVHLGSYGSGKTELSLDEALKLSSEGKKTALVDMDIVNPYFRSGEHVDMLNERGIRTILPTFANTGVDVPSLGAEVRTVLDDESYFAVFDGGGDPVGAAPFGVYRQALSGAWLRLIVNIMRPFTSDADEICEMASQLSQRSGLRISSVVNNAHLLEMTTRDMILKGYETASEVARRLCVEVEFTMIENGFTDIPQGVGPIRAVRRYNKPSFL